MDKDVLELLQLRRGHFRLESGHHGDLWLDLELLCLQPRRLQPFAAALAQRVSSCEVDAVCGPLVEGAFIALMVAAELNVEFTYSERVEPVEAEGLFPVTYPIPGLLQRLLTGKRVAIVNDVINAGSAVRGTLRSLRACGAIPAVIATLVTLGSSAHALAAENGVRLESLVVLPNTLWTPADCPLCKAGVPVEETTTPKASLQ